MRLKTTVKTKNFHALEPISKMHSGSLKRDFRLRRFASGSEYLGYSLPSSSRLARKSRFSARKPFLRWVLVPESPGVYLMRGERGQILYIGKAVNLKRRVASYFQKAHDARLEKLTSEVRKIDYQKTDSVLEALILESALIKKHQPPYNVREKDDKSFLFVEFTREKFPRLMLMRGQETLGGTRFGPFVSPSGLREALKILRRIFPWSIHDPAVIKKPLSRPCFERQIGLCPGTCAGAISSRDYRKNVIKLKLFFRGKKKRIVRALESEMKEASRALEFEKAAQIKRQLFALRHIRDTAVVSRSPVFGSWSASRRMEIGSSAKRIEGYDVSNISGTSAVGSMVVFEGNAPKKSGYRKFRVKTVSGSNDIAMLREIISRRLTHAEWPRPDLMLIDGGLGQVRAAKTALAEKGFSIPIIGIAKGPERKKNEFIGAVPRWTSEKNLIAVRNEAHRFAVSYHRKLRARRSLK